MNECQFISEAQPFRQGDVLVSHPPDGGGDPAVYIVITADCDLAQGKAGEAVMCLPVISAEAFVRFTWVEDKWAKLTDRLHDELTDAVNTVHLASHPDAMPLAKDFVVDWAERESVMSMASALQVDGADSKRLETLAEALNRVASAAPGMAFSERVDLYYDLQTELGLSNAVPKAGKRVNELRSILTIARQDTLFISSIPGQDRIGWVVQLRNLQALPLARLTRDRLSWFDDPSSYFRLGRLAPVYKYALAQQFGQLFARIGLPAEYAGWKELVVADVCAGLYPGEVPSRP